jgi:hypothetical protein
MRKTNPLYLFTSGPHRTLLAIFKACRLYAGSGHSPLIKRHPARLDFSGEFFQLK